MSEWRETTLGESLAVRHGFAFRGEFFRDSGDLIVLTPGNFNDGGGFKQKGGAEKYYDGPVDRRYLLSKGDVVVAMTEQTRGLLGSSATVPESNRYLHNQRLGLLEISDPLRLNMRFCYHLLNHRDIRDQIQATATGAKIRHTAPERIRAVRIRLPSLRTQASIAGILDAIDDLIENNRRRIEVLEQMAQAIYREWFVHFRYPGHEDATFVDSPLGPIPEAGWFDQLVTSRPSTARRFSRVATRLEVFDHFSIPAFDVGRLPRDETSDRQSRAESSCSRDLPCCCRRLNPSD